MSINIKQPAFIMSLFVRPIWSTKAILYRTLGFKLALKRRNCFFRVWRGVRRKRAPDAQTPTEINSTALRLDHIALACDDELERVAKALTEVGVENTSVKTTNAQQKNTSLKDPDHRSFMA